MFSGAPLIPVLNQMHPVHILAPYFLKLDFNITVYV